MRVGPLEGWSRNRAQGMVHTIGLGKDGWVQPLRSLLQGTYCVPGSRWPQTCIIFHSVLPTRTEDSEELSDLPDVIQHVRWLQWDSNPLLPLLKFGLYC